MSLWPMGTHNLLWIDRDGVRVRTGGVARAILYRNIVKRHRPRRGGRSEDVQCVQAAVGIEVVREDARDGDASPRGGREGGAVRGQLRRRKQIARSAAACGDNRC